MSEDRLYKKGDVVRVWSLQSFFYGGFIHGTEGIVSQDQRGGSVLVAVERQIKDRYEIDPSYEVYPQQIRLVTPAEEDGDLIGRFEDLISDLKAAEDKDSGGEHARP